MPPKRSRRTPPDYPARNLSYVTKLGGRTRKYKFFRQLRTFRIPVLFAILLQALVYYSVFSRPGRSDWNNFALAVGVIALVPIISAAVLTALRRHEAPVVISTLVCTALFSVAVSALSALRVPVSYQGLALCLPIAIILTAYANVRRHRQVDDNVALAPFTRAEEISQELHGVPILPGPEAELEGTEVLLIDPLEHHSHVWSRLLADCYLGGVEVMSWTRYLEEKRGRLDVTSFDTTHLSYSPSQLIYARMKRFLDLGGAFVTLPLTVPIALAVAAYIFLRDGGPVIFVQIRRGYGGRRFRMYKFRTMYKGTGGGSTAVGDSRIIPGCKLIRKLRFDELPQIMNIINGDMSLIGPRPVAEYVARSSEAAEPKYALRTLVLPGITGWAQVSSGYAANTREEIEKLSYDLYYIKHLSLDLDLLVLFKTIRTVLLGHGAR
ncbi:sugar transferase [Devosia aurantiaca]|uniref:Sugar transferase n=1 Tax=Devosia aurantiaca TaxID=2714858 RepID=A0A6M1SPR7_9HYPH|nr:sugar transferase [Devosia aurantiaca]NGP18556.1 sugar transferase [Devosia aurantiaca]